MKLFAKTLAAAALAGAAFSAAPVSAQVSGIAVSSPEAVFLRSAARQAAYQQIAQTYSAQIQQIQTLRQESAQLQQTLDTNSDGQLSEVELQAGQATVTQIQQKEQQVAQIGQPIFVAQAYVLQQLLQDYGNARDQVVQSRNIQVMLQPDVVQWAPDGINVTDQIVAALDQRMPTVQSQPPAGWRPTRESLALQQAVQQILVNVAAQQQAAQQQAAQQGQAPQQPSGR